MRVLAFEEGHKEFKNELGDDVESDTSTDDTDRSESHLSENLARLSGCVTLSRSCVSVRVPRTD